MPERTTPKPNEILERGKAAHQAAIQERIEQSQRALEEGVARRDELRGEIVSAEDTIKEFQDAIKAAEDEIKVATDAGHPVHEDLTTALKELQEGHDAFRTNVLIPKRREFDALSDREDIREHIRQAHQQQERKSQKEKKVKELEKFENDANEVLRLEQEINATAQLLTNLWKKDNGWALTFQGETSGYRTDDNALFDKLDAITQARADLEALEGKLFKGRERKKLQAQIEQIDQEPELRRQREELNQKYQAVRAEDERLEKELQDKLVQIYPMIDKIQRQAESNWNKEEPRGANDLIQGSRQRWLKKRPMATDSLMRERFIFVGGMLENDTYVSINPKKLLKSFGYER